MKTTFAIFACCSILTLFGNSNGDFVYKDFDQTLGLVFNGNASTSACNKTEDYASLRVNGTESRVRKVLHGSNGYSKIEETTTMSGNESATFGSSLISQFGHRSNVEQSISKVGCSRRLRLTPSSPSQAGSVFYEKRVPVLKGFNTSFTFQVSGQSKVCSDYEDPMATRNYYRSCALHGGDGFAFVIHSDRNKSSALGKNGQELGYGGIENSLAIEFDMWANVESQGSNDLFHDHIAIHSASTKINSSRASTMLGHWRPVHLADGKTHQVRIEYTPNIDDTYITSMTANDILLPYLKDNGEGRRLGSLAVFVDDDTKPTLVIPLNLSLLLHIPRGLAYVGFTASTGSKWQTHDLLNWHWCDSIDCKGNANQ